MATKTKKAKAAKKVEAHQDFTIIQTIDRTTNVVYQKSIQGDDIMPGNPALIVTFFSDSVIIYQEDQQIMINREVVDDLCRLLVNKNANA